MSRGFFNPTWRKFIAGTAKTVGGAAMLGAKGVAGGISSYGKAIANTNWHSGWGRAKALGLIGVPAAGIGTLAVAADRRSPGRVQTYGDFIAQNNAFGNIPTEQMSQYDTDSALRSSQRNDMVKLNSHYAQYGIEKDAFLPAVIAASRAAAPFVANYARMAMPTVKRIFRAVAPKTYVAARTAAPKVETMAHSAATHIGNAGEALGTGAGKVKNWAVEKSVGQNGVFTPANTVMTFGGIGAMSYGESVAAKKAMNANLAKNTDLRNTTPIL